MGEVVTSYVDKALEMVCIDMGELGRLEADSPTHCGVFALLRDIGVEVTNHKCQTVSPTSASSRDATKHPMSISRTKVGIEMEVKNLQRATKRSGQELHDSSMHQRPHHDVGELEPLDELLAYGDGDPTRRRAVQITEVVNVRLNEIGHLVQVML